MGSKQLLPCGLVAVVALLFAFTTAAQADLAGAKKALDDAKKNVGDQDWERADTNIKMAEVELDGVADTDKKPIQTELDGLKKQMADAQGNAAKTAVVKEGDMILADAKKYLTDEPDASAVLRDADQMDEFLNKDTTKAALSADDIAKYRDQMAKYRKVAAAKHADSEIENVNREYQRMHDGFDAQMAAIKGTDASAHDEAINSLGRDLEILGKHLAALSADNDKVKTMQADFNRMNSAYASVALGSQAKEELETLKRDWDSYADDYKGWETETTPPTFDQFIHNSDEKTSAFNMPKTKALISRADQFLDNRNRDEGYKAVAATPDVKAYVDSIVKMRADGYTKMLNAVKGVVDQAEKATIDGNNKNHFDMLVDDIRLALGEKAPDTQPLQDRVKKLLTNYDAATVGAEQAKTDTYNKLKESAAKAWPDMLVKYKPESGFDPNNYKNFKGKTIKITTDNLMGWRFQPGDFKFATTLRGIPVAGHYSSVVAAAVDDVEKKIGRGLGESDDDGKWEVIATVDGTQRKLMQRKQVEGDLKTTDGEKVGTYKGEYSEPVDAPIITVIAAHCGPLAVSDQGAATESGTVSAPAAVASGTTATGTVPTSTAGGWLMRFFVLIVGLVAAAACLLKAGYAPVTSLPQVGDVQAKLGGENLAYIGLACAVFGVIWLFMGRIIYGLLPNLAIIAAGLYAAIDFLAAKGIVKPDQVAKIKPLGIKIGLACAAAVVLSLLIGGRLVIL